MKIPIDIHTHNVPPHPDEAIVNCSPELFVPEKDAWYSIGIHPWSIAESYHGTVVEHALWKKLVEQVRNPQVLAIGEAGIDKLINVPIAIQEDFFKEQARLASDMNKPLIIHAVKATDELLRLKKEINPSVPWIIHGFRGKAALATEYLRHGFYLSFGEKYQDEALLVVPQEKLFIETDESHVSVAQLYERAAFVRNISTESLRKMVVDNVKRVFFRS